MKHLISDLLLERYCLGELSEKETALIERALSEDAAIRERLDRIKLSNEDILTSYPAPFVAARIKDSIATLSEPQKRRLPKRLFGISLSTVATCAAAAAFFVIFPVQTVIDNGSPTDVKHIVSGQNDSEVVRFKGSDVNLRIYRKTAGEPEELEQNSVAVKGDAIQIGFQSRLQYVVIFSIDGRGNVTLHYPDNEYASTQIEKGKKILLNKSYKLDDAPRYEKFYLVASDVGVNTGFIIKTARDFASKGDAVLSDSLNLGGTRIETFTLRKE
jgi:hypothetical protein